MRTELNLWCEVEMLSLTECQSIRGILNFATRVVPAGKAFLRRLTIHISALTTKVRTRKNRLIKQKLPPEARADLLWWRDMLTAFNGVALLPDKNWIQMEEFHLTTDACNTGYGAQWNNHWIKGQWDDIRLKEAHRNTKLSMPYLEMYALLLAAQTWGPRWERRKINFHCDCEPIVKGINGLDSRAPMIQRLFRRLVRISVLCSFRFFVTHIAGIDNVAADHLSRDNMISFFQVSPYADKLMYHHQMIPPIAEKEIW